jgi:nucleotide-binding universal stress UspA family protein
LGERSGAEVAFLKVINAATGKAFQATEETPDSLEDLKARALAAGVAIEVKGRPANSPHEGILEEAKAAQPDWIIMGRKGQTGLSRLFVGSVTARVIGHGPFSVLVVPREVTLDFRRILVASDGSPDSVAAWREAIAVAERLQSEVVAVSVAVNESRQIDCQLILQHLQGSAARHGVSFDSILAKGRPFEAICQAAQDERADLVVMGTHGRTGLARLLMGSVAERVIGMVGCPVLVAKKAAE